MNQNVVYDWFKSRRLSGDDNFFSINEIEAQAETLGVYKGSIRGMVIKLYAWGYLDVDNKGFWRRKFRLKASHLKSDLKSPLSPNITAQELKKLQ